MRAALLLALLLAVPAHGSAADHYALIVVGAPGGDRLKADYAAWERQMVTVLVDQLGFERDRVDVLSGASDDPGRTATGAHVEVALDRLRGRLREDDLLLLVLMGHGTADDGAAKFNLVGPDLTSADWGRLLHDMPGRLVVVDTTAASSPFLSDLAARGRIVITATDSTAQRYDTVFPTEWLSALKDPAADLDKNGRVSVWELFTYTSRTVARHFEREGLLATERAVLDDSGDGVGVEAGGDSTGDGALARATYLERDPVEATADAALAALLARRRALEEHAEQLRQQKATLPREEWEREFERLMIELARVSHRIRAGS